MNCKFNDCGWCYAPNNNSGVCNCDSDDVEGVGDGEGYDELVTIDNTEAEVERIQLELEIINKEYEKKAEVLWEVYQNLIKDKVVDNKDNLSSCYQLKGSWLLILCAAMSGIVFPVMFIIFGEGFTAIW